MSANRLFAIPLDRRRRRIAIQHEGANWTAGVLLLELHCDPVEMIGAKVSVENTSISMEPNASFSVEKLQSSSMELLEFTKIRERVAGYATFLPAKDLALAMTPAYSAREVEARQLETDEGRQLLDQGRDPGLHLAEDPSPFIKRASLEGALTGLELLSVANLVDVISRARSAFLRSRDVAPTLSDMAEAIPELQQVTREIRHCIGIRGEVVDGATPSLGPLRRQVRDAYQKVAQELTSIIQSQVGREALQDDVITMRGDRPVIQVKAEMRRRVPGIVHGASNTGATLFIEPFDTVETCNTWRELALEEEREVARILRDLSLLVGSVADDLERGTELAARLDCIMARARYSSAINGYSAQRPSAPAMTAPGAQQPLLRLVKARHPLLDEDAVPISLIIGPDWSVIVITGPNTGGKTVAMKTVGLLAYMHQAGLHLPADEGSWLPVFDGIYADVGDQQSIEHSVSTFSSHMRNVIDIISIASPDSLVLLDELGTSTDPEEGSALAKAILGHLAGEGIATITTTHHRTVAAYAEVQPGMMNASVELDPTTLRPTYLLTMGIPGRSYAMSVATRMGLPGKIMEAAESLLEPQYLRFEDWLNELHTERRQLQMRLRQAEEAEEKAEAAGRDLEAQLLELVSQRQEIAGSVRAEVLAQYEDVRRKLRRVEAALSWRAPAGTPLPAPSEQPSEGGVEKAAAQISGLKREIEELVPTPAAESPTSDDRPLGVGDHVDIRGLSLQGTILSLSAEGRVAQVAIGKVRLDLDVGRLARAESHPEPVRTEVHVEQVPDLPSRDLDIRGMRAEPAIFRMEEFLDRAVGDGLSTVRIIHGHGTGVLRRVVREQLERHSLAKSFGPEAPERGGDGVTVVELA